MVLTVGRLQQLLESGDRVQVDLVSDMVAGAKDDLAPLAGNSPSAEQISGPAWDPIRSPFMQNCMASALSHALPRLLLSVLPSAVADTVEHLLDCDKQGLSYSLPNAHFRYLDVTNLRYLVIGIAGMLVRTVASVIGLKSTLKSKYKASLCYDQTVVSTILKK